MQHQIGTDEQSNPININLELQSGNLVIKDNEGNLLTTTIGNPSVAGNIPFTDINQAHAWFLTTSYALPLETIEE